MKETRPRHYILLYKRYGLFGQVLYTWKLLPFLSLLMYESIKANSLLLKTEVCILRCRLVLYQFCRLPTLFTDSEADILILANGNTFFVSRHIDEQIDLVRSISKFGLWFCGIGLLGIAKVLTKRIYLLSSAMSMQIFIFYLICIRKRVNIL